ncbi:hypothetical protein EC973_004470 [Apophysomyces ossiformis]|uniref:Uncharacterized protein n=1 Tax=Apophysomyces ossiformis TaxID=679940 RepID=A0A8H7BI96_9FUNG|nr:hypothetical protein EC973_004470 [Apophysomyces ossiformis]
MSASLNSAAARYQHTATLTADNKIYIIGGSQGYGSDYTISMADILVYDTVHDSWEVRTSQGPVIPSSRGMHTTTWNRNMTPVSDYCYMYDTLKNQWTPAAVQGGPAAGPIYGHSAVLIGSSTLFILLGKGPSQIVNNVWSGNFFILDLNKMAWTEQYSASALNYVPSSSTIGPNNPSPPPSSNPVPLIVGVVVGCLVAVLIGVAVGIYLYFRKKKTERIKDGSQKSGSGKDAEDQESKDALSEKSGLGAGQQELTLSLSSDNIQLQYPLVDKPLSQSPLMGGPFIDSPMVDKPLSQSPIVLRPVMQSPLTDKPISLSHLGDRPGIWSPVVDKPSSKSTCVGKPESQISLAVKPDLGKGQQPVKPDVFISQEESK